MRLKASYNILDETRSSHCYITWSQEAWGCLAAVQPHAEQWKMRQVCAAWLHQSRSLPLPLALTITRV